jgi:hypothetical protein
MNRIEYNAANALVVVQVGHKVFAAEAVDCIGYPVTVLENASEPVLEEIGFEFSHGLNAY